MAQQPHGYALSGSKRQAQSPRLEKCPSKPDPKVHDSRPCQVAPASRSTCCPTATPSLKASVSALQVCAATWWRRTRWSGPSPKLILSAQTGRAKRVHVRGARWRAGLELCNSCARLSREQYYFEALSWVTKEAPGAAPEPGYDVQSHDPSEGHSRLFVCWF